MKLEPVGIVQALSVAGTPMPNSTGVEWLKEVPAGAKLYAIPDGYVVVPVSLLDRARAALLEWAKKYGEHNPCWLPPARVSELADELIAAKERS